jgi:alpha-beta hydrolase superfamily lysophospholipase
MPQTPANFEYNEFFIPAHDGRAIPTFLWVPIDIPHKGIFQIAHGMSEHSKRYKDFAIELVKKGFAVISNDHRGFGPYTEKKLLGDFGEKKEGWKKVLSDLFEVSQFAQKKFPKLGLCLFGHSMGSFLAQDFAINYQKHLKLKALILSGSSYMHPLVAKAYIALPTIESLRMGELGRSSLIDLLSFKSFNAKFRPNRTAFDWLSRDEHQVDAYIKDPYCGFRCSNRLWLELATAMARLYTTTALQAIPPSLSILIMGGEKDPIGGINKLSRLTSLLKKAGEQKTELRLYPNCRHEVLNELNRAEVMQETIEWVEVALNKI